MNITHRQLLSLLRAALWSHPVDPSLLGEGTDWHALLRLAEQQTVVGLVYEGILTLPSSLQPPTALLRQLHLHAVRTAQSHQLLDATLVDIVSRLETEGIRGVLLKGQGVARNYPNPLRRGCGDIDLYVGEPDYSRACELMSRWGMLSGEDVESIQHLHFSYNGVDIEIHRIAGMMFNPRHNRLFRRWSDELLQGETCRRVRINEVNVSLPAVRFDAFYIFYHTYRHLIAGGVGLRQLCDWAMYLHAFRGEIDRDLLLDDLNRFGLLRTWQVMGQIAVHHLGLPEEEFPHFHATAKVEKVANSTMELIWDGGNFGFHTPGRDMRPQGYIAGKLHTFRTINHHLYRLFTLYPVDTLTYFGEYLCAGIGNLFKDKFNPGTRAKK